MPFQPVPDVASFKINMLANAIPIQNTLYVRNTATGWSGAQLASTADAIADTWVSEMLALQHDEIVFQEVAYRDLGDEFGNSGADVRNLNGTRGTTGIPNNVSALVKFTCSGGAPPRDGSLFFAGGLDADFAEIGPAGAYVTAVDAAFTTMQTNIGGAIAFNAQVIVSRFSGFTLFERENGTVVKKPTPRDPAVSNTIESISVSTIVGSQRGRLRA